MLQGPVTIDAAISLAGGGSGSEEWNVGTQPLTIGVAGNAVRVLSLAGTGLTIDAGGATSTTTINNILTGASAFQVQNNGIVVLNGTNNSGYSGTMIINGTGTLTFTGGGAFGTGPVQLNSGVLLLSASGAQVNAPVDVEGPGTLAQSNSNSWNGSFTGTTGHGTLTFASGNSLNLNGAGNGTASQLAGFNGVISLTGNANTNAMLFSNAAANNVGGSNVNVLINAAHIEDLNGGTVTFGSLSTNFAANATATAAANLVIAAGALLDGANATSGATTTTYVIGNASATTFAGNIKDGTTAPTALTKVGTGTLTLTGTSSTYSAGTSVSGGVLEFNSLTALGSNSTTNTLTLGNIQNGTVSGMIRYIGSTALSTTKLLSVPSGIGKIDVPSATAGISFTNTGTISSSTGSTLSLSSAATNSSTFAPSYAAGQLRFNETVGTTGSVTSTGTWIITGTANTYAQGTTIRAGKVLVNSTGIALGAGNIVNVGAIRWRHHRGFCNFGWHQRTQHQRIHDIVQRDR